MFKVSEGTLSLVLCVSKTIVTIRYTNEKILAKNRTKKLICYDFHWHDCKCGRGVFMGGGAVFVGGRAVLVG